MSYQEKNTTGSFISFTLILGFYLVRLFQMVQDDGLNPPDVYKLWGIVIVLGIILTIISIIFMHILGAIIESVKTGGEEPQIDDLEDERDKLIDLKGTQVSYIVVSFGVFLSMLTMVLGQPPLVMFCLLIFFGLVAQIVGDLSRLYRYRRGF